MRLIVGLSGASGQIYGVRMLEFLSGTDVEVHLIVSDAARITLKHETDYSMDYLRSLADYCYSISDIGARISSGSFKSDGMVIVPCSIKTANAIANSINSNLMIRAADVILKQKRKLVLVVRETPLHSGHLRNLLKLSDLGAIIFPPVPAFYSKPETKEDIVNHTIGRILDFFDIGHELYTPWKGL
jgi:4-hydroxy-3-polyprenylbenzoate decarboxylase